MSKTKKQQTSREKGKTIKMEKGTKTTQRAKLIKELDEDDLDI